MGSKAGQREVMDAMRIANKQDQRARNARADQRPFFERYPYALASTGAAGSTDDGVVDQLLDMNQWGEPLTMPEQASIAFGPSSASYKLGGLVGVFGSVADDAVGLYDGVMALKDFGADVLSVAGYGAQRVFGGKAPIEMGTLMAAGRLQSKYQQMSQLVDFVMENPKEFGSLLAKEELGEFQSLFRQHNRAVKAGDFYEAGVHGGTAAYKAIGYVLAGYGLAKTAANFGKLTVSTFRRMSEHLADVRSAGSYAPVNMAELDVDLAMASAPRAVPNRAAVVEPRVPAQLLRGQAVEVEQLAAQGASAFKKKLYTPSAEEINSDLFKRIVGEPRYTKGGTPRSTYPDFENANIVQEIKSGTSLLRNNYQMRLQLFKAINEGKTYMVNTSRRIEPVFEQFLLDNGAVIRPIKRGGQ